MGGRGSSLRLLRMVAYPRHSRVSKSVFRKRGQPIQPFQPRLPGAAAGKGHGVIFRMRKVHAGHIQSQPIGGGGLGDTPDTIPTPFLARPILVFRSVAGIPRGRGLLDRGWLCSKSAQPDNLRALGSAEGLRPLPGATGCPPFFSSSPPSWQARPEPVEGKGVRGMVEGLWARMPCQ